LTLVARSETDMTTIEQTTRTVGRHSKPADAVAAELGVDPNRGLDADEVERRLNRMLAFAWIDQMIQQRHHSA